MRARLHTDPANDGRSGAMVAPDRCGRSGTTPACSRSRSASPACSLPRARRRRARRHRSRCTPTPVSAAGSARRCAPRPARSSTVAEDGAPLATVTAAAAVTRLPRVARWRCDRRARELVATAADGATAAAAVRTPSCRDRLAIDAPRRARPGRRVALRVRDRWGLGDAARDGLRAPARRPAALPRARARHACGRGSRAPGEWRLRVRTPWQRATRSVRVARPGGRQRLLVTGDSMIQPLDDYPARARCATTACG